MKTYCHSDRPIKTCEDISEDSFNLDAHDHTHDNDDDFTVIVNQILMMMILMMILMMIMMDSKVQVQAYHRPRSGQSKG